MSEFDPERPSRALDFAVARAVGWTDILPPATPTSATDGHTGIPPEGWGGTPGARYCVPEFSGDGQAFVGLLGFLTRRGLHWEAYCEGNGTVCFGVWRPGAGGYSHGATVNIAACLAVVRLYSSEHKGGAA